MTKVAFKALAKWLKSTNPKGQAVDPDAYQQWQQDVEAVIQASKEVNPRFDSELFKKACGW